MYLCLMCTNSSSHELDGILPGCCTVMHLFLKPVLSALHKGAADCHVQSHLVGCAVAWPELV